MYSASWKWQDKANTYVFTNDDILNLARAIEFEGKPRSAVLWTLLQRFAMLRAQGVYSSLSTFLQAYVQPINPEWFPNGAKHLAEITRLGTDTVAVAAENKNALGRLVKATTPWTGISAESKLLVDKVLAGEVLNSAAPTSIHYWASRAKAGMTEAQAAVANQAAKPSLTLLDLGTGFGPGVNVFFTSTLANSLAALRFGTGRATNGAAGLVAVGIAVYVAYRVWG